MLSYSEPVVVNAVDICSASGCESWCVILCQWLLIMACHVVPKVANHGVLF